MRAANPGAAVELLVPDFRGDDDSLHIISASGPNVVGHNIETVRRLQRRVRDRRASYDLTLAVLERLREIDPRMRLKSSIMLGLGETRKEVTETMTDLKRAGVDMITIGQYLRPRGGTLPVAEYVRPEVFEELRTEAVGLGFTGVVAGPFVRSSYRASELVYGNEEGE
ncbi:MAG: hypothetical protein FJ151_04980 [Euryarchaeota archaeon]|nr:hypothetical protein [Euryarchaeota archaeon]